MKRVLTCLMCVLLLVCETTALADDSYDLNKDGFSTSYTYGYDYWGDVQASPDAYRVSEVIDSVHLGLDLLDGKRMNKPQALFARGNDLYVCDTGNNRILQIRYEENGEYSLQRIIDKVNIGGELSDIKSPYDVYVDEQDNIYVADYGNFRVVKMDKDLNWILEFTKPSDATFDQNLDFLPKKIVIDNAGRLYALVQNVNKGLVKFEADGVFTGFIGANNVVVSTAEYIWKRYFQTQEQRSKSEAFVPTEYENICIDKDGFIYATNTVFSEYDLKWDNAKPVRRLNGVGTDILIKNDRYPPIGDLYWEEQTNNQVYGPSRFTDITVFDNDIYVLVDRIRGRIFGYDSQGIMLWAFGTKGNIDGAFNGAVSIEHMGYDLFVLDQLKGNITVFKPTEYGTKIYSAIETYLAGDYDSSATLWNEVMKLNANYPMAFRGIGRALLRQDKFKEAMDYFERAHDRDNYGRAFKLYRKEWVEKNVWWIVLILAVLLLIPVISGRINRMKWEVIMHEQSKVHKDGN
ncbi:MAG: hypothetical protein MJ142_03765 [Clostridia bacterium]|nr:hypothetical protein [Clostridia bacterium]